MDKKWFEKLNSGWKQPIKNKKILINSKKTQQKAIEYFRSKRKPSEILFIFDGKNKNPGKPYWTNILKVLDKWIDQKRVLLFFLEMMQDLNWPGSVFAWNTLVSRQEKIVPTIDKLIKNNKKDKVWVKNLKSLKDAIIKREYWAPRD